MENEGGGTAVAEPVNPPLLSGDMQHLQLLHNGYDKIDCQALLDALSGIRKTLLDYAYQHNMLPPEQTGLNGVKKVGIFKGILNKY